MVTRFVPIPRTVAHDDIDDNDAKFEIQVNVVFRPRQKIQAARFKEENDDVQVDSTYRYAGIRDPRDDELKRLRQENEKLQTKVKAQVGSNYNESPISTVSIKIGIFSIHIASLSINSSFTMFIVFEEN